MYDVIVIGAGPAGMMAAGTAAQYGKNVLIIEKNKIFGRKLLITGKGRCNVTNIADTKTMLNFITTNSRFLYSAFSRFSNYDTIDFFENAGVPLKTERGGRVFPVSDKSSDIADAMRNYASAADTLCDEVLSVQSENGTITGVVTKENGLIKSDSVIVATGGLSYPLTGSTGDGYRFAEESGHTVVSPRAALVPVNVKESYIKDLQGLSLKNIRLTLYCGGKEIYSDMGEMLFTHFGVSGPLVLSASCHMKDTNARYIMSVDLKPALNEKTLDARLIRDFTKYSNKDFINSLSDLLPAKLIPIIAELSGIDFHKKCNEITREERSELRYILKNFEFTAESLRNVEEAIITSGGVNVKEINPSTMESKITKGLFFAGEVLDVEAYTGGYNLQIAFSSGYLAGISS